MEQMARQGITEGDALEGGTGTGEVDKFRFLGSGEELSFADAQARRRIAELEARVAELEKQPQIWTGTDAQYEIDNAAGKIREGSIIISIEEGSAAQALEAGASIGVQGVQEGGQA